MAGFDEYFSRKMAKSGALVMNNTRMQNKRQKIREERKRVARLCVSKLQNIHDPESFLCKSVLINNTLRNIQLQHRESLKRTRLHRQNFPKDHHEFEAKRQCLDGGTIGLEGQLGEEVEHSLCNSYYDVSSGDSGSDVILCDTFSETDISSTVDISITTTTSSLGDIEEESLADENLNNNNSDCDPGKGGTFQVTYCIDTMTQPQSIVQNNTITLKSF